jgi:DNA ligase (NAD+)
VEKFVKSTDIQGIGTSVIEALFKNKFIETAADLYLLKNKESELADLILDKGTRFGEKRAAKLIEEIEKKRKLPLNEFLGSLGITSLGKRRVAIVIESLKGKMDSLTNWLDGVTLVKYANESSLPNVASNINDELIKKKDYILRFIKNGLTIASSTKSTLKDGAFIFCLTGKFDHPKDYYHSKIEQAGHGYTETYSKSVNYLVTNDLHSGSSKMEKAKKNGTKVITADELLKLIGVQ